MQNSIGLCLNCKHARRVPHPRQGADYWRCGYADTDIRLARYPQLPVLECPAYERNPKPGKCNP